MRGSCSPSGRSTTRVPPSPVRATTMPGWSATHSPITAAPAPCGCARIAASTASASLARHEGHQPALVGHVQRVQPEEPAGVGDGVRYRHGPLGEHDAGAGGGGDLVQRGGEPAAGGVAQHVHVRA